MARLAAVPLAVATFGLSRRGVARRAGSAGLLAIVALIAACAQRAPSPPPRPVVQAPAPSGPTDRLGRPVDGSLLQVGLLLPLTGAGSDVGQAMQRAAQMAMFDTGTTAIELLPRDTGDDPIGASEAARSAIADGADLILGPLFSNSIPPVAGVAQGAGINVVAFSTDVSRAGGNVYLLSIPPQLGVERVVEFATSRGLSRFAVLAPDTPAGQLIVGAARDAVYRNGGDLAVVELYDANLRDPGPVIDRLRATPVDAVLLGDAPEEIRLQILAPLLGSTSVPGDPLATAGPAGGQQLLGTGQWDGPATASQRSLVGGWFAAPDPSFRGDFEGRYAAQYGAPPPRLATYAYDAVALAAALAAQPSMGVNPFDRTALEDPSGFSGIDGVFRFSPGGIPERGLAVLEVQPGGSVVIDPAPQSFGGPAF